MNNIKEIEKSLENAFSSIEDIRYELSMIKQESNAAAVKAEAMEERTSAFYREIQLGQ